MDVDVDEGWMSDEMSVVELKQKKKEEKEEAEASGRAGRLYSPGGVDLAEAS